VDIPGNRPAGNNYCLADGRFPGDKGGGGEPREIVAN